MRRGKEKVVLSHIMAHHILMDSWLFTIFFLVQGCDCVPLEESRRVLSFPDPLRWSKTPASPRSTHSQRSPPPSERREFCLVGVLGGRPFFSSGIGQKKATEEWKQAGIIHYMNPFLPERVCAMGWSWAPSNWAWIVSTTLLNLRLGPKNTNSHTYNRTVV